MSQRAIRGGRSFVEIFAKNNTGPGLKSVQRSMDAIGRGMLRTGAIVAGVGTAILAPIAGATQAYAEFDDAMRSVEAVATKGIKTFGDLRERAKELGRTTSFTATEVARLMIVLGRAGFNTDQIDAMTESVLNLSRATGTDATLSAGIMSATIRQFGLDASHATRVADALTATSNAASTDVQQLGDALSYAGKVAADNNLSLEDTLAILGGLGNVGIQGSSAGNALRRLLAVTGAEAKKLKAIFGVEFTDAANNTRPLLQVLGEVNEATKNLGTADRMAKFNAAFGLLGITSATAIGGAVGDIGQLTEVIENSQGEAERAALKMDAGLGGSYRKLNSAIEGVVLAVGKAFAPAMQFVVDIVTRVLGVFTTFIANNEGLIVALGVVGAVLVVVGASVAAIGAVLIFAASAVSAFTAVLGVIATIGWPVVAVLAAAVVMWGTFYGVLGVLVYRLQIFQEMWQHVGSSFVKFGSVIW
ncbi:MAG: phage tail tape measure protein, partial [Planctomycetota bacterium]